MADTIYRYPGAQPFRDDEFSRRTFFGRESASMALTDQIMANRLVVVYAKSGLGKTSLLNAGVAPRLREADSLPLFVRVNDTKVGPLPSVFEQIKAEAERQHVEYMPGDTNSVWSFFKSVEFWKGDLLLSPVLIADQFEELFTLQPEEEREKFLSELGYLVRGIAPPSQSPTESQVSTAPPAVHVVLSLREDFLGLLEEASDRIPEIMDHRFRLASLTAETAAKAITGPATIADPNIATRPFRLEPEFVTTILDYLTKSITGGRGAASRYVEPFHLQLICQRIEKIVAIKQQASTEEIIVGSKDVGGETALAQTLGTFYTDAIWSLKRQYRGAVRQLCEQFLISPEGRRLSLEERELQRQLKLPHTVLSQLVDRRLLRTDRRSDSTYYELSHDALVQPVLAGRRVQALIVGWVAASGGSIVALLAGFLFLVCIWEFAFDKKWRTETGYFAFVFWVIALLSVGAIGVLWLRAGIRRRRRYRRRAPGELTELPTIVPFRSKALAWIMLALGFGLSIFWGLLGLFDLVIMVTLSFTHGQFPRWLAWVKDDSTVYTWQEMHDRPLAEVTWMAGQILAIVGMGWVLIRSGARKLWPHRYAARPKAAHVPGFDRPPSLLWPIVNMFSGIVALVVAILCFFTTKDCISAWHASLPYHFLRALFSAEVSEVCQTFSGKNYSDIDAITFVLFTVCTFAFAVLFLHRGIRDLRLVLRTRQVPRQVIARAIAVAGAVLIIGPLLYFVWQGSTTRNRAAAVNPSGQVWAVGNEATILHSEDGGRTWETQAHGTGWLYSVNFPTPMSGWVTGSGGAIWHSEDGGETWPTQTSGTNKGLSTLSFVAPQFVWVVGMEGTILHSDDSGKTWKAEVSGTSKDLVSVYFVTPQLGWVVGSEGLILHTEDGGGTWKSQKSGTQENLGYVIFITLKSGWVVGGGGTILHTEDGGRIWNRQNSGTVKYLAAIAFPTPQSGWIVGNHGAILHTNDSGETWNRQLSDSTADLTEVTFPTPQSGWVAGHQGVVLHTDDGGDNWIVESSGTNTDLQSVAWAHPRGSIGVQFAAPPESAAPHARVITSATIAQVMHGGPAERAGLQAGDNIVAVNGRPVKTPNELVAEIGVLNPGTNVNLGYIRDGKPGVVNVSIADYAELFPKEAQQSTPTQSGEKR
jgi:photosystem II stability/assembly factor-like uncharacterized protein